MTKFIDLQEDSEQAESETEKGETVDIEQDDLEFEENSKPNDFARYALVDIDIPPQDGPTQDLVVMDGTSHTEISLMLNQYYSSELAGRAKNIFDLAKLKVLESQNPVQFYIECENQVKELYRINESLVTHTTLFTVTFLIAIGLILNMAEDHINKKSKYIKWLRERFGHKHLRYFQHAKQLARMGDFAKKYASIGKNRLLDFDRLSKEIETDHEEILRSYPFEDTTEDLDGGLFKEHVDSIITLHRLQSAEITFADYDQAVIVASSLHYPIAVQKAKSIKEWLDKQDFQEEALEDLLLNRLVFPYGRETKSFEKQWSLNKILAGLIDYSEKALINDDNWVNEQKSQVSSEILVRAHEFIINLANKLGFNSVIETTQNTKQEGEQHESISG